MEPPFLAQAGGEWEVGVIGERERGMSIVVEGELRRREEINSEYEDLIRRNKMFRSKSNIS